MHRKSYLTLSPRSLRFCLLRLYLRQQTWLLAPRCKKHPTHVSSITIRQPGALKQTTCIKQYCEQDDLPYVAFKSGRNVDATMLTVFSPAMKTSEWWWWLTDQGSNQNSAAQASGASCPNLEEDYAHISSPQRESTRKGEGLRHGANNRKIWFPNG